ncbi:MAG TPA: hypothetical protein DD723_01800 [Candidatus Omnitrophica bacterium]|nr:MAG: hypothetical protein A2Z81_08840 [Omnitrophica WOR_2 bacterium GWA2_45_18]OGX19769.1 MAG: hypothetical protein A2Y04_05950 [Omnitrophica WOR_2 bacterium GWC2_45_7]HBR14260.1 hypothetical protein [Candidatus Omnitrophota bacterium]
MSQELIKSKYLIPTFILGMSVTGLAAARSLGRNGIKVYALDPDKDKPGLRTRYAKCFVCPDPQKDPKAFMDFLLDLVKTTGAPAVLMPTSDVFVDYVNTNRDLLIEHFKFAMSPKSLMDRILDKNGQYDLARENGTPVPKTYLPKNLQDIQQLAGTLNYPVLLKGVRTDAWRRRFGDKKAFNINNSRELVEIYQKIHDNDHIDPLIQEVIQGDDTCHYKICTYMNSENKPLLTFTLQKIRQYPCRFGIGSMVMSVWEPEVARLGLEFMQRIGYRGVGSIEFKKDKRDNQLKMIELNPRLWAQNSLPEACGQNFALTAYLDIIGEKVEPQTKFQEGVKWIAFKEDRASFYGYLRTGEITWKEWLNSVLTGPRVWANWSLDDPLPFLHEIKFGFLPLHKIWVKVVNKIDIPPH